MNDKPPFLNLFDIAGILLICIVLAVAFWLVGSSTVTGGLVLVLVVLFIGAVVMAKKGDAP